MGEFTYRHEINLSDIADEHAKRPEERVDEMALDRAADTLERFGYVKVVRCRDCKHMIHFWHHDDERWQCADEMLEGLDVSPSFYCAWGERKEGE